MGRPMAYPWGEWLKPGNRFELVYNKHYTCSHMSMSLMLRQRAASYGVSISVGINKVGNGLIVDVRPRGKPMGGKPKTTTPINKRIAAKKVFPKNEKIAQ